MEAVLLCAMPAAAQTMSYAERCKAATPFTQDAQPRWRKFHPRRSAAFTSATAFPDARRIASRGMVPFVKDLRTRADGCPAVRGCRRDERRADRRGEASAARGDFPIRGAGLVPLPSIAGRADARRKASIDYTIRVEILREPRRPDPHDAAIPAPRTRHRALAHFAASK